MNGYNVIPNGRPLGLPAEKSFKENNLSPKAWTEKYIRDEKTVKDVRFS